MTDWQNILITFLGFLSLVACISVEYSIFAIECTQICQNPNFYRWSVMLLPFFVFESLHKGEKPTVASIGPRLLTYELAYKRKLKELFGIDAALPQSLGAGLRLVKVPTHSLSRRSIHATAVKAKLHEAVSGRLRDVNALPWDNIVIWGSRYAHASRSLSTLLDPKLACLIMLAYIAASPNSESYLDPRISSLFSKFPVLKLLCFYYPAPMVNLDMRSFLSLAGSWEKRRAAFKGYYPVSGCNNLLDYMVKCTTPGEWLFSIDIWPFVETLVLQVGGLTSSDELRTRLLNQKTAIIVLFVVLAMLFTFSFCSFSWIWPHSEPSSLQSRPSGISNIQEDESMQYMQYLIHSLESKKYDFASSVELVSDVDFPMSSAHHLPACNFVDYFVLLYRSLTTGVPRKELYGASGKVPTLRVDEFPAFAFFVQIIFPTDEHLPVSSAFLAESMKYEQMARHLMVSFPHLSAFFQLFPVHLFLKIRKKGLEKLGTKEQLIAMLYEWIIELSAIDESECILYQQTLKDFPNLSLDILTTDCVHYYAANLLVRDSNKMEFCRNIVTEEDVPHLVPMSHKPKLLFANTMSKTFRHELVTAFQPYVAHQNFVDLLEHKLHHVFVGCYNVNQALWIGWFIRGHAIRIYGSIVAFLEDLYEELDKFRVWKIIGEPLSMKFVVEFLSFLTLDPSFIMRHDFKGVTRLYLLRAAMVFTESFQNVPTNDCNPMIETLTRFKDDLLKRRDIPLEELDRRYYFAITEAMA